MLVLFLTLSFLFICKNSLHMKHSLFVGYLHSQLFLARSLLKMEGAYRDSIPSPCESPDWDLRVQVGGGGGDGGSFPLLPTLK